LRGSSGLITGTVALQKGIRVAYLDQMVPGKMLVRFWKQLKGDIKLVQPGLEKAFNQRAEKVISPIGTWDSNWIKQYGCSAGMKRQSFKWPRALAAEPGRTAARRAHQSYDIDFRQRIGRDC